MPSKLPLHTALTRNVSRPCALRGCERPRHKLSKHCRLHDERRRRWGHPRAGRCWRGRDIDTYADVSREFLTANAAHKGIQLATQWLDAVLDDAAESAKQPAAVGNVTRALRHLASMGVTGEELLVRCVAATLYLIELPEPDQELVPFTRNLGHHCLRAAPGLATGAKQRKYGSDLGSYFYSSLKTLLVHIIAHKRQLDANKRAFEDTAKESFNGAL